MKNCYLVIVALNYGQAPGGSARHFRIVRYLQSPLGRDLISEWASPIHGTYLVRVADGAPPNPARFFQDAAGGPAGGSRVVTIEIAPETVTLLGSEFSPEVRDAVRLLDTNGLLADPK